MSFKEQSSESGATTAEDLEPITVDLEAALDGEADESSDEEKPEAEGERPEDAAAKPETVTGRQPKRPSGQPGRSSKFNEIEKAVRQANERAERLEQILQQQQQREIELIRSIRGGGKEQDPLSAQMNDLRQRQAELVSVVTDDKRPAQERQAAERKWYELEEQRVQMMVDARVQAALEQQRSGQTPEAEQSRTHATILTGEFPEVMNSAQARQAAHSYYEYLVLAEGRPQGLATQREAAAAIAAKLGLGGTYRPSPQDRASGMGPASRDNGASRPGKFQFGRDDLRVIRGSGLSPQQIAKYIASAGDEG